MNENISNLINNKQEVNGVIIIYGVYKFMNIIDKDKMDLLSENLKKYEKISLIMIDDYNKFKNFSFDLWFSNIVNLNDGIWIGKGIVDQSLFHLSSINKEMTIDIKNNMGYFISEGSVTMCKFVDLFTRNDEDGE